MQTCASARLNSVRPAGIRAAPVRRVRAAAVAPVRAAGNIVETAKAAGNFNTLIKALETTGACGARAGQPRLSWCHTAPLFCRSLLCRSARASARALRAGCALSCRHRWRPANARIAGRARARAAQIRMRGPDGPRQRVSPARCLVRRH
jgi:hypothetical protein